MGWDEEERLGRGNIMRQQREKEREGGRLMCVVGRFLQSVALY